MPNYAVTFQPRKEAIARIFCIPYAGASAAYYRSWLSLVPQNIELVAIEIPGRAHLKDRPAETMQELIETILPQIKPLADKPFVLYGHSYGSIIAYELAKKLSAKALFVSSRRAPHLPSPLPMTFPLPDNEFLDVMQNMYNAVPEAVLKEKELLNMLLPILKEDIRINETYIGQVQPPLEIPVIAMYGNDDKTISVQEMKAWKEATKGQFTCQNFDGGHFFIDQVKGKIISAFRAALYKI